MSLIRTTWLHVGAYWVTAKEHRLSTQLEPAVDFEEYTVTEHEVTDNLDDLLAVLPPRIRDGIRELTADGSRGSLIEIVMDLGRRAEARFQDAEYDIGDEDVTRDELEYVAARIGQFGDDNRAGIERTLHRISAIRNRSGEVVGLTCRIGRAVYGTIAIIRDLVESGESLLLLGRPGVGKTTMLREIARVLADDLHRRVIVVDTSNEIAGDGDIPHPAIGRARRMQVATPTAQHGVMIEAVENHMPEVIVIDEIGTELEAGAARTIAERGVQLIGTAHGNTLENLMMNPTLSDLIGGIQSVTLSDEEARRRGTQKSILERKAPPTFSIMVELIGREEVAVHRDVAQTVDAILRGAPVRPEVRRRAPDGTLDIESPEELRRNPAQPPVRPTIAQSRGDASQDSVDLPGQRRFLRHLRSSVRTTSRARTTASIASDGFAVDGGVLLQGTRHGGKADSHLSVRGQSQSAVRCHRSPARSGDHRPGATRGRRGAHAQELLPYEAAADSRGRESRNAGLRASVEHVGADGTCAYRAAARCRSNQRRWSFRLHLRPVPAPAQPRRDRTVQRRAGRPAAVSPPHSKKPRMRLGR